MKRFIKTSVLCLSLIGSVLMPAQKSEAMVGAYFVSPAIIIAGCVYFGMGPLVLLPTANRMSTEKVFNAFGLSLVGYILLDSPTTPMTFSAVDAVAAKKLNSSKEDVISYNSELDEVRATGESISKNLMEKFGSQKEIDFNQVNVAAEKQWNKVCASEQLSAGTCRVIQAIRHQK